MASQSEPSAETLIQTANAYLQVFTTMDPNTISDIQSDDFTHNFAPASLNPPALFTRETFASHLTHLAGVLESFPVHAKQIWPNPSLNQVTIWADSETKFHQHVKDDNNEQQWQYKGEYIWILTMDQTGRKVKHVLEFLDSKGTEHLMALVTRAFKKKEEVEGTRDQGVKGGWEY